MIAIVAEACASRPKSGWHGMQRRHALRWRNILGSTLHLRKATPPSVPRAPRAGSHRPTRTRNAPSVISTFNEALDSLIRFIFVHFSLSHHQPSLPHFSLHSFITNQHFPNIQKIMNLTFLIYPNQHILSLMQFVLENE